MALFYANDDANVIKIYDPRSNGLIEEKVYGKSAMLLCYGNPAGLWVTTHIKFHKTLSVMMGMLNNTKYSTGKIKKFVKNYSINTDECERGVEEYKSFNDFFARKLKDKARTFPTESNVLMTPGDGRLLVFPKINKNTLAVVKWAPINLNEIFGNRVDLQNDFADGSCAILRLCPVDYHRFHFPANGIVGDTLEIAGHLQSVHPYALEKKLPVFCTNKRTVCVLESDEFGKIALLEIGALLVGGIKQTYKPHSRIKMGDEKGYFEFGASTCILFFQKDRVKFSDSILAYSEKGIETLVRLGDAIGTKL